MLNIDILIDNLIEIKKKKNDQVLLATIKQEYTRKNCALQMFYQLLHNIHYEKDTGWVARGFLFVSLFIIFSLICVIFFFISLFYSFVYF